MNKESRARPVHPPLLQRPGLLIPRWAVVVGLPALAALQALSQVRHSSAPPDSPAPPAAAKSTEHPVPPYTAVPELSLPPEAGASTLSSPQITLALGDEPATTWTMVKETDEATSGPREVEPTIDETSDADVEAPPEPSEESEAYTRVNAGDSNVVIDDGDLPPLPGI